MERETTFAFVILCFRNIFQTVVEIISLLQFRIQLQISLRQIFVQQFDSKILDYTFIISMSNFSLDCYLVMTELVL